MSIQDLLDSVNSIVEEQRLRSDSGSDPLSLEEYQNRSTLQDSVENISQLQSVRESLGLPRLTMEEMAPVGFLESLGERGVSGYIPFVGGAVEAFDLTDVYLMAERVKDGTGTEDDEHELMDWWLDQQVRATRGTSWGGKVGEIASQLPAFAGEFVLTGGAFTAGRKVGVKAARKLISSAVESTAKKRSTQLFAKRALRKTAGETAGGVAGAVSQATIGGVLTSRWAGDTLRDMMPGMGLTEDEYGQLALVINEPDMHLGNAIFRGWASQVREFGSERLGWMIGKKGIGRMLKNTPVEEQIKGWRTAVSKKWLTGKAGRTVDQLATLKQKIGWHGIIGEIFEERAGELIDVPIDAMTLGELNYAFPGWEHLTAEAVAFALPGAGFAALNQRRIKKQKRQVGESVIRERAELLNLGETAETTEEVEAPDVVDEPDWLQDIAVEIEPTSEDVIDGEAPSGRAVFKDAEGTIYGEVQYETEDADLIRATMDEMLADNQAPEGVVVEYIDQVQELQPVEAETVAVEEEVQPGEQMVMFSPATENVSEETEVADVSEVPRRARGVIQPDLESAAAAATSLTGVEHSARAVPKSEQSRGMRMLAAGLRATGLRLVPIDVQSTEDGASAQFAGFASNRDSRVIYVQNSGENAIRNSVLGLVAHEATHALESENPDLFNYLVSLAPVEIADGIQQYSQSNLGAGVFGREGAGPNIAVQEGMATAVQEAITRIGNIEGVTDQAERSLLERLADWFRGTATRLGLKGKFAREMQAVVNQMVAGKDIAEIELPRQARGLERARARGLAPRAGAVAPAVETDAAPRFAPAPAVNTPEFRRWFKDSKVVDEQGNPLVMYHGTAVPGVTVFETYGTPYGLMGTGTYFTDSPGVASGYATGGGKKAGKRGYEPSPNVVPTHLSIQNPLDMDAVANLESWVESAERMGEEDIARELLELKPGVTNEKVLRAVEEALAYAEVYGYEGAETVRILIENKGHDGVTHVGGGHALEGPAHRVYIAFEPTQIKSVTGNVGTFDPAQADIRFAPAPQQEFDLPKTIPGMDFVPTTAETIVKGHAESSRKGYLSPLPSVEDLNAEIRRGDTIAVADPSGNTGYLLRRNEGGYGWDMQALYSNDKTVKGAGVSALVDGIARGATTLDAFEGYLTALYHAMNFRETHRTVWSDEFKPPAWNYTKDGRPDVVLMTYVGETTDAREIAEAYDPYNRPDPGSNYFGDWPSSQERNEGALREAVPERPREGAATAEPVGEVRDVLAPRFAPAPAASVPRSSAEIRRNPEKYRKAIEEFAAKRTVGGKPAGKRITVRVVGEYLQELVRSEQGAVDLKLITSERARGETKTKYPKDEAARAEQIEAMSDAMVDEVLYQNTVDQEGLEWYTQNIVDTLEVMSFAFPEVATDPLARQTLVAFMAITSSENSVEENLNNSIMAYEAYRTDGSIEADLAWRGKSVDSVRKNMIKFARFMRSYSTPQEAFDWMNRTHPVKEVDALISGKGKTGRLASERVYGSLVFGPKIGAFFQNLRGNLDVVTQDRWFSRTVFRHAGNLVPETTQEHVDRFREAMAEFRRQGKDTPGMEEGDVSKLTEDQIVLSAIVRARDYSNRGYKKQPEGSIEREMDLAANAIYKSLTEISQAPGAGGKRNLWDAVVNRASEKLKDQGQDLDPATIQAIIWYYEKQLYAELGAPPKVRDNDFLANALRVIPEVMEKRDGTGSWERATEGTRWSGDRSAEQRQPRPAPSTVRDRRASGRLGESVEGVRGQAPAFAPAEVEETPEERRARKKAESERVEAAVIAGAPITSPERRRAQRRVIKRGQDEARKEGRAEGRAAGKKAEKRALDMRTQSEMRRAARRDKAELGRRWQQQARGARAGYKAGREAGVRQARQIAAQQIEALKNKAKNVRRIKSDLNKWFNQIFKGRGKEVKATGLGDIKSLLVRMRDVETEEQLDKFLKDLLKLSSKLTWKETQRSARIAVRRVKKAKPVPQKYRDKLNELVEQVSVLAEGKPVTTKQYDVQSDALAERTEELNTLLAEARADKNEIILRRKMTEAEAIASILGEIKEGKDPISDVASWGGRKADVEGSALSTAGRWHQDITSLIQRLTGRADNQSDLYALLVTNFREAEDNYNAQLRDVMNKMNDAAIEAGFKSFEDAMTRMSGSHGMALVEMVELDLPSVDGRVSLTPAEAMHLMLMDPMTRSLIDGGVELSLKRSKGGQGRVVLTSADLDAVEQQLDPKIVKFAETMRDVLETDIKPGMFDAVLKLTGAEPDSVEGYWPRSRDRDQKNELKVDDFMNGTGSMSQLTQIYLENAGATKSRQQDRSSAIFVTSAMETFVEHVDMGLRLANFAEPIRIGDKALRNDEVKRSLIQRHGIQTYKMLREYVATASGLRETFRGGIDRTVGAAQSNVAVSYLAMNPRTWLVQLTSIPRFVTHFSVADITAGVRWMLSNMGNLRNIMSEESGYFWRRWARSSAERFGPQKYGEIVPYDTASFWNGVGNVMTNLKGMDLRGAYRSWSSALDAIQILNGFDGMVSGVAYGAAQARLRREGVSEADLGAEAAALAADAMRDTQNSTSTLDLTMGALAGRQSPLARMFLMFSSDPLKTTNILIQGGRLMKEGQKAQGAGMIAGVIASSILATTLRVGWYTSMGAVVAGLNGGDDDKKKADRAAKMWENVNRGLVRELAGLTFFGPAIELASGIIKGEGGGDAMDSPLTSLAGQAIGATSGLAEAYANLGDAEQEQVLSKLVSAHVKWLNEVASLTIGNPIRPWVNDVRKLGEAAVFQDPVRQIRGLVKYYNDMPKQELTAEQRMYFNKARSYLKQIDRLGRVISKQRAVYEKALESGQDDRIERARNVMQRSLDRREELASKALGKISPSDGG